MRSSAFACFALCCATLTATAAGPWTPLPGDSAARREADARATESRLMQVDRAALRAELARAPHRDRTTTAAPLVLSLPAPDGREQRFTVEESQILHPELQAKFPHLRTYAGRGLDDPSATLQLDDTDLGLRAQVLSARGTWVIDTLPKSGPDIWQVTELRHARPDKQAWDCQLTPLGQRAMFHELRGRSLPTPEVDVSTGAIRRTFRAAIASPRSCTNAVGGTVSAGLSFVVTTINRVAGLFERELSVSFQLVANNNLLIYTNATPDPYTTTNAGDLVAINQSNLDSVIGSANYDIGHVFNNLTGGLAQLEAVCEPMVKARGKSGHSDLLGTIFWQGYVCHEFGHQFGAGHTFNSGQPTRCQTNRDDVSAVEPGSGSTIMSYGGTCPPDDYPNVAKPPNFHAKSFIEMTTFLTTVACGSSTSTGNQPPVLAAQATYTIPNATAFALTASGSDPDGDVLVYAFDSLSQGPPDLLTDPDNGASPLFRFQAPTGEPRRVFPNWDAILLTGPAPREKFPTFVRPAGEPVRPLNFRVVARDNRGGVAHVPATVHVVTQVGPFAVNNPSGALNLIGGTQLPVRWNVAGTTANGIDTPTVNVRLSTDGGLTYPLLLAGNVPNNGEAIVTIPSLSTAGGRIQVEAVGNIFFAVNNANLTISPVGPTVTPAPTPQPTPTPTVGPTPTPTPTPVVTPTPFPAGAPRLANVSTRLHVDTGENVAIGGFVLQGTGPRRVLIRALGPSLAAFNVPNPLADPTLELFSGQTSIGSNDDWRSSQQAEIAGSGFAPTNDAESALVVPLAPGAYTAILRGKNGGTGIGLVEVYDLDGDSGSARLGNLSTRGRVLTGDSLMIGGFVIGGTTPKRVLIRATGHRSANSV